MEVEAIVSRAFADVGKIIDITYNKRSFRIFDRDCLYTMTIKYAEPSETYGFGFGFPFGIPIPTIVWNGSVDLITILKLRYKNEEDAKQEILDIQLKQDKLKKLALKLEEMCE